MVQAAPNESRVRGVLREVRPDPDREGFVVLSLEVERVEGVVGEAVPDVSSEAGLEIVARASDVEGLSPDDHLEAALRMTGPGEFMARDVRPVPAAEAASPAPRRPTRRRRPRGRHTDAGEPTPRDD